jgi:threonine/homoserine/homoserine lactone efflux protein
MDFFIKGLILGFSIAAPVGPIGLLCIRRTLAEGRVSGFVTGLGAATADALYGAVAAFGLTAVSSLLLSYQVPIRIIGGIFLLYVATKIFFSKPAQNEAGTHTAMSLVRSYVSTFFLTLTNPSTVISFIAVFAGLGIVSSGGYGSAGAIVLGVFIGSTLWWLLLSTGLGSLKTKINDRGLVWVNRISGLLMAMLGIWSLVGSVN